MVLTIGQEAENYVKNKIKALLCILRHLVDKLSSIEI
jgi:hypothetical protein